MTYIISIPSQNEEETIKKVITEFLAEAKCLGISAKCQIVDDYSTDNTKKVAECLGIPIYPVEEGTGLAAAFRTESKWALETNADCLIHIDADGQHDAKDLKLFIDKISEGYDLVLGNRLYAGPKTMSKLKYLCNIFFSKFISIIVGQRIKDSQTGYRAIRREVLKKCYIRGHYTYAQEQIIRAAYNGFRIIEVPTNVKARLSGHSRQTRIPFKYVINVCIDLGKLIAELVF